MNEIWLIRSTYAGKDEAVSAARVLLTEKLIACANISSNNTALYRWEGTLQEEAETVLLVKTIRAKLDQAMKYIKETHSYQTPAIIAYRVEKSDDEFAQWIKNELS